MSGSLSSKEKENKFTAENNQKQFSSLESENKQKEEIVGSDSKALESQKIENQQMADNREDIAEFTKEYQEDLVSKKMDISDGQREELLIDGVKHQILKVAAVGDKHKIKTEEGVTWLAFWSEKIRKMWLSWQNSIKQDKIKN